MPSQTTNFLSRPLPPFMAECKSTFSLWYLLVLSPNLSDSHVDMRYKSAVATIPVIIHNY